MLCTGSSAEQLCSRPVWNAGVVMCSGFIAPHSPLLHIFLPCLLSRHPPRLPAGSAPHHSSVILGVPAQQKALSCQTPHSPALRSPAGSHSSLFSCSPFFEDYKLFWMRATSSYDCGHCPGKKTPEQPESLDVIRVRAWESLLRSHLSCLDMASQTECCMEAGELFTCLLSTLFSQHLTTPPATPIQLSAHTEL